MPVDKIFTLWRDTFQPQVGVVLVWTCLLLLPFGRTVEVPVFAMAIWGICLTTKGGVTHLKTPGVSLFTIVFLCLWLPALASVIDAYNFERTLTVVLGHLRFYFSGLFIIWALSRSDAHYRFQTLCAWLLGFWVVDAIVQAIFGFDLLGIQPWSGGTTALFGPHSSKFAVTLAVLTPFLWEHARRAWPFWVSILLIPATVFAVLSGGSRAGWVALIVVLLCYFVESAVRSPRKLISWGIGAVIAALLIAAVAYQLSPHFRSRIQVTIAEVSGQRDTLRSSLQHRVYIWGAAWRMFLNHPINGVGARGFRYAFPDYATETDPFFRGATSIVPTHSHNLIAEIATETGIVGLTGAMLILAVLARAGWNTRTINAPRLMPYAAALIAANFPLNTHWAIFSSFWSQVVWWLIALFCAAYGAKKSREASAESASV